MVAMPAPRNISTMPRIRARHACHRHREVILPRTTWTFQVAPDAGCALRTGGPSDMLRRLCHCGFTPRACIAAEFGHTAPRDAQGDDDGDRDAFKFGANLERTLITSGNRWSSNGPRTSCRSGCVLKSNISEVRIDEKHIFTSKPIFNQPHSSFAYFEHNKQQQKTQYPLFAYF